MFYLVCVAIFVGQLQHFTRNCFLKVNISAERLLLQCNYFGRTITFLDQLLLQSSYFPEQSLLFSNYLAKLLPTSYFQRIGSFQGSQFFRTGTFYVFLICSNYQYLQKSFFPKAGNSAKYQIFQKNCFFDKVTSSDQKCNVNFKIYDVTAWLTNNYDLYIPQ